MESSIFEKITLRDFRILPPALFFSDIFLKSLGLITIKISLFSIL